MAKDGPAPSKDEELGQIREIIFGRQMRDYEKRFSQLHEDVQRTTDQVRETLEQKLAELQTRMGDATTASTASFSEVRDEIGTLRKSTETRMADLDNSIEKLRADFADQLQKLRDETVTAAAEADARWKQRAQQMDDAKLDRSKLAKLLADMARHVGPENVSKDGK